MKLLWVLIFSVFVTGCSSKKYKTTLDVDEQEVVKKFDLSKEIMNKFSEKTPVGNHVKKRAKRKRGKKSYKKKMKKVVRQKKRENYVQRKKSASLKSKEIKKKETIHNDPTMAEGYPELFVKYDKNSEKIWDQYKENIYIGEKAKYKVKYLGATAGNIEIETLPMTSVNGQEVYHFKALVKTAKYYSFIYWVNDTLHSYVERDGFLPLKYVLSQREKKQDIDDLQLFDRDRLKTIFLYRKLKKGKTSKKDVTEDIPFFFQDSFSSIQFVRGLPLQVGKTFYYPIVNKAKHWILKMHVQKIDTIEIMDKDVKAYKIAAETKFPGALKKTGDIFFWYSTDSTQKLLKFEGKVKIGTLAGEMIEYHAGQKLK